MHNYFMGIDNGGTLCKAVLFDADGRQVATASQKLPLLTPHSGFTEREMESLWRTTAQVVKDTVALAEADPQQIRGVACAGHGKGLYLWGKDGVPCYNGIVSTDGRAWEYSAMWAKDGTAAKAFAKTYQQVLACQPVALLRWLKEKDPEILKQIQWIFAVKDYIRFRLTGEAYAEITDYSGTNLLNLATRQFDRELLALFGIEEVFDALPPLKGSTDLCGTISEAAAQATGLATGTPVAGGMFDIDACAIAMDITAEDYLCVIAGTWSINEYIAPKPVLNKSVMMNSIYCIDDFFLVEECSPTSAGNLEWIIDTFLTEEKQLAQAEGVSVYAYCNRMVASIAPETLKLIFLPHLFGSNYNSRARACFIGMESHHRRDHMVRAVFEGIVFCHLVHLEKLLANRDRPAGIRLAGGAAKSKIWAQMFADVTGLPVETIVTEELGALGAAMAAAVAAGEFPDLKRAADTMVRVKTRFEPDPPKYSLYRQKFETYKSASAMLEPLWERR